MGEKRKEHPTNEKVEEGREKKRGEGNRVNKIIENAKCVSSDTKTNDTTEPSSPPSSRQKLNLIQNGDEEPPRTPFNPTPLRNTSQQTPSSVGVEGKSHNNSTVAIKEASDSEEKNKPKEGEKLMYDGFNVELEVSNEEYVLRIKRRKIECSTDVDIENGAKQMAQSAGILLGQAKMLKEKGNKQLDQYLETLQRNKLD